MRADLGGEAEWIGLIDLITFVARPEPVFVERPLSDAGGEPFPDAGDSGGPERMNLRLPAVEVADHRNALRIGGPNGEARAAHSVLFPQVGAELFVRAEVAPFRPQVLVEIGQGGCRHDANSWCLLSAPAASTSDWSSRSTPVS